MYSSSVLKLAGNIHPYASDSQINAITSILQGHDTIASPNRSWQVANLKMYPVVSCVQQSIANEGRSTNIYSPICISSYISDKQTSEKPS